LEKTLKKTVINAYKYITTIYFKRAFFMANSKRFLRIFTPGPSYTYTWHDNQ
jgi:hypothetical protein